jgi:hypothetical protein
LSEAPAGIVGKFVANRPVLAISVFSIGLTALAVVGSREAGGDGARAATSFIINALIAIALPIALVAMEPRTPLARMVFFGLIIVGAGAFSAASLQMIPGLSIAPPPLWLTLTSLGFMIYLFAMSPMLTSIVRLGVLGPFAAILGVAGAAGHLAVESLLLAPEGAAAASIALAIGASIGAGVSADFSRFFARGFSRQRAAAAAGHAAIAPIVFALLSVAALFLVQTVNANFGAVEWRIVWAGLTAVMAAAIAAMLAVTGSLSLENVSERAALDENRRRQWFAATWRPVRRMLPATTAIAVTAIAGVFAVVALFEAGFDAPISMISFFILIAIASAVSFVSARTSLLIVSLLGFSVIVAGYGYAALGLPLPAMPERLAALTLGAIALGHLTLSWRDAGDHWRGARDIAEHALSDGLRRFLFLVGAGAVSLFIASQTFQWRAGAGAAQYFLVIAFLSLLLAPPIMIAMSTRMRRY